MTTPNPSRSVSPEPTKGESVEHAARVYEPRDVYDYGKWDIEQAFLAGARWQASAYIPLVEAAREVYMPCDELFRDGKRGCTAHMTWWPDGAPTCNGASPLDRAFAALVQVPGQQQAEAGSG